MQVDGFRDRRDAGRRLADALAGRGPAAAPAVIVGLARGGVPVAYEVAVRLGAPLDVLVVRKLGAPGQPELALGALAPDGVRVLNADLVRQLGVTPPALDALAAQEARELERRARRYRSDRPPLDPAGRTAVLVDDGLATGASMRAAVAWARRRGAARVVVAVPVAARQAVAQLAQEADDVVAVAVPPWFDAVGAWYTDFSQTSDAEVVELLDLARARPLGG
ncbi:MAG TPA: phosphoribosyltransferase family protein [Vicinamibacterales bacterium]|nr:phosphoribosyltransferase family protein [Vicinamibacterales bacterium]